MTAPNNPTPEVEREALVGKLWAMHGISQSSNDGFTYLNDAARVVISQAAATISRLTAERDAAVNSGFDLMAENAVLSGRVAVLEKENGQLRLIVSESASACGAHVSPECSIEFMSAVPNEITLRLLKDPSHG